MVAILLTELCQIQTGLTVRGRLELDASGVRAIQIRDLADPPALRSENLSRFALSKVAPRYLVGSGDVLFRSRGERTTAVALDDRLAEPAVAILPLFILRPRRELIAPAYLAWSLNQAPAQRHFDLTAQGQTLRMVSKASLDTLEIDVPDLATQHTIVACDTLAARERELALHAAELRRRLNAMILVGLAGKQRPRGASKESV